MHHETLKWKTTRRAIGFNIYKLNQYTDYTH